MRATDFEFRHRFWFIFLLFWAAFSAYFLDRRNAGEALARLVAAEPSRGLLQGIFLGGALLVGLAALLRTWATAYLRTEIVHDSNLHTEGVVADGPFRHLRNPLYLGNLLLAVGMGLLASRLGFVILVLGNLFIILRLIGREEAELLANQGESYRAYYDAVPRLLPSPWPRVPAGGLAPRWLQGFLGEAFFWILFAGTLYFALTLEGRAILWVVLGGFAVYLAMLAVLKRRRAQA
jgi:hypothetical protein